MTITQHTASVSAIPPAKSINCKISLIFILLFICYIPTLFIQDLIQDRSHYQELALNNSNLFAGNHITIEENRIQLVSDYRAMTRAAKYSPLFISLTFALFFLFEVLSKLRIHPVNYGLVGLALGVFYLLLVSLSEIIGFIPAYLTATGAVCGLIVIYTKPLLDSWVRTGVLAGLLVSLYTYLLILLQLEQYSLLFGSILAFATLSTIMLSTKHINWYDM